MRRSAIRLATASLSVLATAAAAQTVPPAQAEGATDVEAVVVTAAPFAISADALTANVAVITRQQLDVAPAQGLGDLLSGLPGLRSTFFGPGASRPVVRGLAGPRVQVLTNGVGQIDASALSPDHAVATDPAEAKQIEVLRGPSTLLYGGSAIGGVINIIDERVPDSPASGGADGRLSVQASTVDQGRQASGQIKIGEGPLVFTADVLTRRSEDYDIPGPQISRQLADVLGVEREDTGTVRNSAVELEQIGAGLAYLAGDTRLGASVKRTETTYGIVAEEDVTIALEQTRVDLRGETPFRAGPFETARLTAGFADYEHAELESQEVGTRFLSDGVEGRLDLIQAKRGDLSGSVGVQALRRSFEAIGEEAYVPSTDIEELGVYTLQRLDRGAYGVEGGLRLDSRRLESLGRERDFTNLSASAGVFARPSDGVFLGLSIARAQRAPREEELFAEGPHIANQTFEVGNEAVEQETAYSVEGAAHMERGRFSGDLHLYAVRYEGFIDFRPTGEVRDDLPVFQYVQTDAEFTGAEAEASYRLWEEGRREWRLEGVFDIVRADTDLGAPPRIPPYSATARLVYEDAALEGRLEVRTVGEQDRVAAFELPTDGYTLVNLFGSWKPPAVNGVTLFAEARNLTNEEAREHASFLKDVAPLPGRNLRLGLAYRF